MTPGGIFDAYDKEITVWGRADLKDVDDEARATIDKMVERLEEFDDVQNVYTNMKPAE